LHNSRTANPIEPKKFNEIRPDYWKELNRQALGVTYFFDREKYLPRTVFEILDKKD